MSELDDNVTNFCSKCVNIVTEPYIVCCACVEVKVILCLHCFAKGVAFGSHESDHSYTVIRKDFSVFESHWSAAEEIDMLSTLADCGYGNWADVSQRLKTKTKLDCERHYNKHYINEPQSPLEKFEDNMLDTHPQPLVYKLSDDPPRYPEHSASSVEMGGYMAARGDFNTEFNNYQELDVIHMAFEEEEDDKKDRLEEILKVTTLEGFWEGLKERGRRKKIIREHGLISLQKLGSVNRRYDTRVREIIDKLRCFVSIMSPFEHDKFVESLSLEQEIRTQIKNLQEFRENGVTGLRKAKIFKILKKRRQETKSKIHLLDDILVNVSDEKACQLWLQRQALLGNLTKDTSTSMLPNIPRKSAPPLDIIGMPGYDKLDHEEREVCAAIRLVPEAYIEFRSALVNECRRNGCLKLGQARSLIKIDVNKTRRLYDYLISQGSINRDPL